MRHMFLVLDCSRAMEDKDLKPDRMVCSVKVGGAWRGGASDSVIWHNIYGPDTYIQG